MKFQAYLAAAALSFGLADAQCNANNCARAVTGTRLGPVTQQSRRQDCSSFMRTTITRPTSTVFVTATSTGTDVTRTFAEETVTTIITITVDPTSVFPLPTVIDKRQASTAILRPIPFYASACSGASAYSSACSCWGIRPTFVTLSTNTVSTVTFTSIDRETISITTPGTTTFTSFTRVTIAPSLTIGPSSTFSTSVVSSSTTTTGDDDSSSAEPTTSSSTSSEEDEPTSTTSSDGDEPTSSTSSDAEEPTTTSTDDDEPTSTTSTDSDEPTTTTSSDDGEPTASGGLTLTVEIPTVPLPSLTISILD